MELEWTRLRRWRVPYSLLVELRAASYRAKRNPSASGDWTMRARSTLIESNPDVGFRVVFELPVSPRSQVCSLPLRARSGGNASGVGATDVDPSTARHSL